MLALPEPLRAINPLIFPVQPGGKLPATTHGWHEASNDPAQIARWERMNPNWNWGVACGLSGLFVLDIDPNGLDWWAALLKRDSVIRAAVNRAFTVRTPRGGLHVYFRGEGPSTASRIADGIDTRGGIKRAGQIVSGGYVVLPGSSTDKGTYEILNAGEIAPYPDAVLALIPERKAKEVQGLEKEIGKDLPRNVQTATDLLTGFVKSGSVAIEGHGGDNLTLATAAIVLSKGISQAKCFELMQEIWNPHCVPPWDEWELELKIRNAYESGTNTKTGAEGHQSNAEAFDKFAGMEIPEEKPSPAHGRTKLQLINDFADSVEDPKWLLPGMLPEIGVGMLYGQSGSYKSFVALDLSLTLAFGVPGQWENPCAEKQDVVFFAGESPIGMARLRFPAWMEAHEIEFRNDHRLFFMPRVPLYTQSDLWRWVKEDLEEANANPALIVIDTKSRLITGIDENASKDGSLVIQFLEQMRDHYQCCVLLIDHVGKDASKGARGSSVYFANADFAIEVKKMARGMEMTVRKQKEADVEDAVTYFETKVYGPSIVLRKTEKVLGPADKKKGDGPVISWATFNEVADVLETLGGSAGGSILAQTIAVRVGVEARKVLQVLNSTDELKILRNGNRWELIQDEPLGSASARLAADEDDDSELDYDL